MTNSFPTYAKNLSELLWRREWDDVEKLAQSIAKVWQEGRQFFLCGNGGSAANATHLANDFLYGISSTEKSGLDVEALTANTSVLTCLANDEGYDEIFSIQLEAKAKKGDLLLVLSGSGNSMNVIRALQVGTKLGMTTFAILGLTGGRCLHESQETIYFPGTDMQMSEDLQLIVGHMCMQYLKTIN